MAIFGRRRAENQCHPRVLALGASALALAVVFLGPGLHQGQQLSPAALAAVAEGAAPASSAPAAVGEAKTDSQVCDGWKPKNAVSCSLNGCDRLFRALQDENCRAALKSPTNARRVGAKLEKLGAKGAAFTFFRGADGYFFYNMACEDPNFKGRHENNMQRVMSSGDTHLENFGVIEQANGQLVWGVNDYDQAVTTPFIWDVKRGATANVLACEQQGFAGCADYARSWFRGYASIFAGNCTFTNQDRFVEGSRALQEESAGAVLALLTQTRAKRGGLAKMRAKLAKKIDFTTLRFLAKPGEVVPVARNRIPAFQAAVERYLFSGVSALALFSRESGFFKVLDAAQKFGSGTGSIGLDRYLVLVQGDGKLPRILEMKQVTESVVEKYINYRYTDWEEAGRVVYADKAGYPYANVFYGSVALNGIPFVVREKNAFKASIDWRTLEFAGLHHYAEATGRALALFHSKVACGSPECALDSPAQVDTEVCSGIQKSLRTPQMRAELENQVVAFAKAEAARQTKGQRLLSQALAGASEQVQSAPWMLLNSRDANQVCKNDALPPKQFNNFAQ